MTIGLLSAEVLRTSTAWGRRYYQRIFGALTRSSEAERFTGASFVFLGALSAVVLFPATVAILAMLFMSLGDTAAALVGIRYGRLRIGNKTLEGTAACFVVCLATALAGGLPGSVALAGAATATIAELIPWGIINDNVAIPLFAGGVMTLMMTTPL
jgi:dolichol kinase